MVVAESEATILEEVTGTGDEVGTVDTEPL
jgi:hypothetical protein